jgi:predicted RNase H-like HicB family nuclease
MKVREAIEIMQADGWYLVATRGQPPAIQAPCEAWPCDDCRKAFRRLGTRHIGEHIEAGRLKRKTLMRYAVVIEKAGLNYSAYVPDLPGCVATGSTPEEAEREIREAIRFHLEGLEEDGTEPPKPEATLTYVEA